MDRKIIKAFIILFCICTSLFAEYKAKDYSNLYGMKGFDKSLLSMHFKLYQGYVKNTNSINELLEALPSNSSIEYGCLKRMYGWEFDGMRLHEYYFDNLGGSGNLNAKSDFSKAIAKQYGSFDNWKKDFIATGLIKGIGWAILYEDPKTGRFTNSWINEHDLGHLAGNIPLIVMDVFEHAYITQYGLDRKAYIEAFFDNLNYNLVEKRYEMSQAK